MKPRKLSPNQFASPAGSNRQSRDEAKGLRADDGRSSPRGASPPFLENDPRPSTEGLFITCRWEQRVRHWLHGDGKLAFVPASFLSDWWSQNGLVYVHWDHPHWHKPEGDRWIAQSELQFLELWEEALARLIDGRVW